MITTTRTNDWSSVVPCVVGGHTDTEVITISSASFKDSPSTNKSRKFLNDENR